MNIYLIKKTDKSGNSYDVYNGHVICADRVLDVRHLAASVAADEGTDVWLDAKRSSVFRLAENTKQLKKKILLSDFNAG